MYKFAGSAGKNIAATGKLAIKPNEPFKTDFILEVKKVTKI
ncbi:hypothetical protein [Psychrobium sp. 1_MG-2023]|nr:hypothetical protein [Psychrobium sp. 1_MG-2023]MDP2562761.1 hypothetical protein [Psychrobium sp. 1_MG-2023]